ncbi:glycosyltransferase [Blastococcus sp. TML/C7B]|uniref:glycosyltransferase n=1 Tax=Blastococcus sp. TML/C7B TaxID=2798728 RepID=UPI0028165F2A|nr:glycosyltransferase [Blastococcus sp. TML/C7B]
MKVLVWHVHGSWTTAFVQGGHEYLLPVVEGRGPDGLGRARTWDWPASAREVTPEQLRAEQPDVVVLQRVRDLELVREWLGREPGRDLPAVFLEHNAPGLDDGAAPVPHTLHPVAGRSDIPIAHVTHFNRLFYDNGRAPTTVIEHGIVDPGERWTGELARAAVVTNEPVRRGRTVGADLLPGLAAVAPVDVFGMGLAGLHERYGLDPARVALFDDPPQAAMHAELARRRVYVHPVRWTSLGLSLLEAMHLGMPVVALATTEVVEAVPAGAGLISTRARAAVGGRAHLPARRRRRPARRQGGPRRGAGALRARPLPARLGRAPGGGDPVNIHLVSEHASPLAAIGGVDAGGQNVHVAALAAGLAQRGHDVTVHTRRDDAALPERVVLQDGYEVVHVPAGPARELPKDDLLRHMPEFAANLRRTWAAHPPDLVHAHFWMSGLASVAAAGALPVVQTFHALGSVKRRHQGDADTSPPNRIALERSLCGTVDHVVATCTDEVFELRRLGLSADRVSVVPCGVDTAVFTPDGPVAPRTGRRRLLVLGRLVERKGQDDAVRALRAVPDAELVVVGGPPPDRVDADPEVRRLRAIAAEAGVADRLVFAGSVARADVHRVGALGRRGPRRPLVRAVRHHAAGGDGLRPCGRGHRRRRAAGQRRRRRDR